MSNVILSDQAPQPGARQFPVSFSPPRQPPGRGSAPNNLELSGPGTVTVTADSVVFADEIASSVAPRRTIALADVVNVGYGAAEEIIVVRTRNDSAQVLFWMRSPEDSQALLSLLPKETTPEFVEAQAREAKFREHIKALAPHARVTTTIIAINVALFLIMLAFGAGLIQTNATVHMHFGSNFGPLTWTGEPWRLLTAAFIHFGVIHLAFNMYALYSGGDLTERLYGSARFAVIYLVSALAGNVVSGWWDAARNSAGASGAVFGVYGALLVFFAMRRDDIPVALYKAAGTGALMLCAYSLVLGAANPFIDNSAHVGGLLGGALAGFLLVRPFDPAARTKAQPWRLVAVSAGLCAALALLAVPLWWPGA
jgi:rhomboid protease GluP